MGYSTKNITQTHCMYKKIKMKGDLLDENVTLDQKKTIEHGVENTT